MYPGLRPGGQVVLAILTLAAVDGLNISYTKKGRLCMTECVTEGEYTYCYTGWERYQWDYCTPGAVPALQYFTSQSRSDQHKCTSQCGRFGHRYSWCYTSSLTWDYCAERQQCGAACRRGSVGYACPGGGPCSPPSVNYTFFRSLDDAVTGSPGEYTVHGYRPCPGRFPTGPRVDDLAAAYRAEYGERENGSRVEMEAPPVPGEDEASLPLVVRVELRNPLSVLEKGLPAVLGVPLGLATRDFWFQVEASIATKLRQTAGRIIFTLVLTYRNLDSFRRPTAFAFRFLHLDYDERQLFDSGDCFFINQKPSCP